MRIFVGLTEVSGYYARLHRGLIELGVDAEFYPLQEHRFVYSSRTRAWVPRLAQYCVAKRITAVESASISRIFWLSMVVASRAIFLVWALARFDVFLLGGGSSFFRFREFGLMRLLGRRIIYTFHGTDSRPAWMDGFCQGVSRMSRQRAEDAEPTFADLDIYRRVNEERRETIRRVERYANAIVNAPPQAQFHMRPYVIGLAVGIPVDDVDLPPAKPRSASDRAVHILHSPSFHIGKGSEEIRAAIQALKDEGLEIDYREISNRPNLEVRHAIVECDFIVDQVYSDSPMAGFAAEAALAGKPAVVCGYYSGFYERDLPNEMRPPSLYCQPNELKDAIRILVRDASLRVTLGREAQQFVRARWSPREVAARYLSLVEERIPDRWMYVPERNRYFYGMGLHQSALRCLLGAFLSRFGASALGLDDAPVLREKVLEFVSADHGESPCASLRSGAMR